MPKSNSFKVAEPTGIEPATSDVTGLDSASTRVSFRRFQHTMSATLMRRHLSNTSLTLTEGGKEMRILRRFIKGAVFGIAGISLLTLASWNSQAQVPTRESEPKARILVGKEATPTKTGLQEQPTRQPQPLSLEEKRRFFRSVINSLAEQSKLNPNSNSAQVFSPNLWKPDFDLQ